MKLSDEMADCTDRDGVMQLEREYVSMIRGWIPNVAQLEAKVRAYEGILKASTIPSENVREHLIKAGYVGITGIQAYEVSETEDGN